MSNKIQIVFGPTASGKTEFSIKLAKKLGNSEIINADSMQVYKEIPIITNQPTDEEMQGIPHHLFSIKSILEYSDLSKWLEDSVPLIKKVRKEGNIPILVGGTGMYLKAIVDGISNIPEIPRGFKEDIKKEVDTLGIKDIYKKLTDIDPLSKQLNEGDTQRVSRAYEVYKFTGKSIFEWNEQPNEKFFDPSDFNIHFVDVPREEVYAKINSRFEHMLDNGLLNEAEKANDIFTSSGLNNWQLNSLPAYKAHGLREIIEYLNGGITKENAIEQAQQATRNYAKRQFTWWRSWNKSL